MNLRRPHLALALTLLCTASAQAPAQTLRALASARGLLLGGAVSGALLDPSDPDYARTVKREYNAVVAENAMKWAALHSDPDSFVFTLADALVNAARANGQTVRGHTLLWYQSVPAWVYQIQSKAAMQAAIRTHVQTVMKHFAGRVNTWDVVNEAVSDDPGHGLRSSPFKDLAGPEYIAQAFRWAHETSPQARLYYNDYGAEGLNGKSDAIYKLVKGLLAQGVPIHGVGFQTHVNADFSPEKAHMKENLQRFKALGLDVQLTEVDVQLKGGGSDAQKLNRQAQVYAELLRTCLAVKCSAFMMWGVSDASSWRSADRPLIFDEGYQKKPAYDALVKVLSAGK